MIKVVFFGTGAFAAQILKKISEDADFRVIHVITAPDKPAGRKMTLIAPAVKTLSEQLGIKVVQPSSLKEFDLPELSQADLGVVAEYGFIIPKRILDQPQYGTVNLHGSILPKLRGASPIQTAIMNGEDKTGVTLMLMDEKMDHGPIISMSETNIRPDENKDQLFSRLSVIAAELLLKSVPKFISGEIIPIPQNHEQATFCRIISRDDGKIDFSKTASEIYNTFRALSPWPGIWTQIGGKRLKLSKIMVSSAEIGSLKPGQIKIVANRIYIGCADQPIEVLELQLEGKKMLPPKEFINGMRDLNGTILV